MVRKYLRSQEATSKVVLAAFIFNLYNVDFPDLNGVQLDSARHLIQTYDGDAFVNFDGMLKAFRKNLNKESCKCIKTGKGDHHEFTRKDSWAFRQLMDFVSV